MANNTEFAVTVNTYLIFYYCAELFFIMSALVLMFSLPVLHNIYSFKIIIHFHRPNVSMHLHCAGADV